MRHGIAEKRRQGHADSARALTAAGRQKLRAVLRRARQAGVSPAVILTSPYIRAVETAKVAADVLGWPRKPVPTRALLPSGSPARVWREVQQTGASNVLICGHEPLLSNMAAFLLQCPGLHVDLKKGSLICIETASPGAGAGVLKWMLTPKLST